MARKKNTWDSYQEYLKSDEWELIRDAVHDRDENTCQLCGNQSEATHHHKYPKDWNDDSPENCIAICKKCHSRVHGHESYHDEVRSYDDVCVSLGELAQIIIENGLVVSVRYNIQGINKCVYVGKSVCHELFDNYEQLIEACDEYADVERSRI